GFASAAGCASPASAIECRSQNIVGLRTIRPIDMRGKIKPALYVAACVVGVLSLWGFWWEPSSLRVSEQCIAVKWNQAKPLRIAVLSDLHVGSPFNGLKKLKQVVEQTNAATPDLIFILGDFVVQGIVGGTFVAPEDMMPILGGLRARYGVFSVLG